MTLSPDWIADCMKWHGRVLTGEHRHWCNDWDFLPIDETCEEEMSCCTDFASDAGKDGGR